MSTQMTEKMKAFGIINFPKTNTEIININETFLDNHFADFFFMHDVDSLYLFKITLQAGEVAQW
jgi:hypothetical protein